MEKREFQNCKKLITHTKIYEISGWIRNIILRVKRCKNRIDIQNKWFDFVQQSLFHSNVSMFNSTQEAFSQQRMRIQRQNLWRYYCLSILAKKRMNQIRYFSDKLRQYVIYKKREKWYHFMMSFNRKNQINKMTNDLFFYRSILCKWRSFFHRIVRIGYQNDFLEAYAQLQKQKKKSQIEYPNSFRRDWISMAKRLKHQKDFQKIELYSNMKFASSDYEYDEVHNNDHQNEALISNTKANYYRDSFMRMTRNYILQVFFAQLDKLFNDFIEKQKQKKIRKKADAQRNWRYLVHHHQKRKRVENLNIAYNDLQEHLRLWNVFYHHLYLQNIKKLCEDGLVFLDVVYIRISQKWKFMIVRTLLNKKKNIISSFLQEYREKQANRATEFGAQFLSQSIYGIKEIVQDHYRFTQSHYKKTKPRTFWKEAANFTFSFTHKSLYDSINLVLPYLTTESSDLAKSFTECKTVITHAEQNPRNRFPGNDKKANLQHKNVHIIIGFGYNDKISLLDSVDK